MREEVSKLTSMDVVTVVEDSNKDPAGKFVDLKEVFDCELWLEISRQDWALQRHSPRRQSGGSIRLFLLFHLVFGWKVLSIDISDA